MKDEAFCKKAGQRSCPVCEGQGYFVYDGGPGRFDEWFGNWLPTEIRVVCQACSGSGEEGEINRPPRQTAKLNVNYPDNIPF